MVYDSTQFLVTLADAKTYLGMSNTNDDEMISMFLQAIRSQFDEYCGKTLISSVVSEIKSGQGSDYISVNNWPIDDTAPISAYFDPNGLFAEDTKIDPQFIDCDYDAGMIRYIGGAFWKGHRNTKIIYTGPKNYTAGSVPAAIQAATMEMLGLLYQRKTDKQWTYTVRSRMEGTITLVTGQMPQLVKDLLAPYRNLEHDLL